MTWCVWQAWLKEMEDTMENWDEEKLRTVVLSKAGNPRTTTDVSSIHFVVPRFNLHEELNCHIDCVQILHPSDRNGEVRAPHYLASFMSSDPLTAGTDGSGNALTVTGATTDTHCRPASYSSRRRKPWKQLRRRTRLVWRSSLKWRCGAKPSRVSKLANEVLSVTNSGPTSRP